MYKTLIGKNNYLFLQNDSARELEVHNDNLKLVDPQFYKKYETVIDKFLMIVFPNKSYIYKDFLPDNYNLKYRTGFDIYNNYLQNHILDGYELLKDIDDTYYKTDTHINTKGALIVYNEFIKKINQLFNLNIITYNYTCTKQNVGSLISLNLEIGDLTRIYNLGDLQLESLSDTYYGIVENEQLFMRYVFTESDELKTFEYIDNAIVDKTYDNINKILDWQMISSYILFKKNKTSVNNYKVIIFYDSFLLSTFHLYMNLFYEVYCVKNYFNIDIVNLIQPDYVFEFRVERFLF
jgi:hypothetical protein